MTARSWLFVPGDSPEKLDKALKLKADALIVDLEDAVSPDEKLRARLLVSRWLEGKNTSAEIWVRVNADSDLIHGDLRAVAGDSLSGVVVPKIRNQEQADAIVDLVGEVEAAAGVDEQTLRVIPMIEKASAVLEAEGIARIPRVLTLMIGEYDLAAELGVHLGPMHSQLAAARFWVILACSAAGIRSPVAPVSTQFADIARFRESTESLKNEGHYGRAVIHPAQIKSSNDVFTPSAEEVDRAKRNLELYEASLARGEGVTVDDDGRLIDEATIRLARRTLNVANRRRP